MSEQRSKETTLSSVAEMSALAHEVADLSATSSNWKDRVAAAAREFGMTFGRAKRLYFKEARRVDAEEMDRARAAARELRERESIERENAHLAWLECQIGRLRASGEEFHGPHVDGLEHLLRVARRDDRALAVSEAAEGEAR